MILRLSARLTDWHQLIGQVRLTKSVGQAVRLARLRL